MSQDDMQTAVSHMTVLILCMTHYSAITGYCLRELNVALYLSGR